MNSVFKNALVWVLLGSALIFIFNNVENASSSKREMISYSQFKEEWLHTTEDKNSEYKEYMDKCRHAEKLQTLYNNEDTKMLLRLIHVRNYLWLINNTE